MVAINQNNLADMASRLIKSNGRDLTVRTIAEGTFDFTTNTISSNTASDETVKGVITDFKKFQIDDQNIKADDKMALFAAKDVTGTIDQDTVIIDSDDSTNYHVINVDQLKPGTVNMIYKVQIRK